jgi:hypothetical protein
MKAILEFNLPEEKEEYFDALNGQKSAVAFTEVWDKLFRPRHKYGYGDDRINELMFDPVVSEIMEFLEKKYLKLKEDIYDRD